MRAVQIVVGTVVLGIAGILAYGGNQPSAVFQGESPTERTKRIINNPDPKVAEAIRREVAHNNVLIEKQEWTGNGIGVMTVSFTFSNQNDFDVHDLTLDCKTFAQSGTALSEQRQTVYVKVPKKGRARAKDINFGFINPQSKTASCRVTSVKNIPN